jgi:DNA-binding IclR family transcriptional regulator
MRYKRKRKMIPVYLDTNDSILLKSKDKTFHVLFYILKQADAEHNTWYADKVHKQQIIDKLAISPTTLDKHLASLKERRLIHSAGSRGKYKLNMQIFSL